MLWYTFVVLPSKLVSSLFMEIDGYIQPGLCIIITSSECTILCETNGHYKNTEKSYENIRCNIVI